MDLNESGDLLDQIQRWRADGQGVAVATVISTWGSAPCAAGSQLVVNEEGSFQGSVSGGCIEGAVIEQALLVIEAGGIERLRFGVTNEMAWEVGLACGGDIEIFLERVE